ncbi:alanine glycine permease [Deinococcus sp. RL]|uniref:alanine/glycine:cation symporter family protein n=1 Tax=Deinococcus sp. RL TaxID=1489678 RepID=UPI0004DB1F9B|nr:alanine/glycine:cation symporter family protein [Deinococcus sp. RL]KEF33869.1 alanine glycine permease [Deinococcus sp. RL]
MQPSHFRWAAALGAALTAAWAGAQAAAPLAPEPPSLDERISAAVQPVSDFVSGIIFTSVPVGETSLPLIVLWLIAAGIVFTLRFGFINLRGFWHGVQLVRGRYTSTRPESDGQVTHFQALATAVSGTVGLGNIAGVAVAISLGGPGATLWMILAGLLGMTTKFVECTLGVKYRRRNPDGTVSGGPMHYLRQGLAERGQPGLGRVLAGIFAVCCVGGAVGGGNMFQSNQAFAQLVAVTGGAESPLSGYGWAFGLLMAVLAGTVIIGGIRNIAQVTSRLVPLMAAVYVGASLVVLGANAGAIPGALAAIWDGAFSPEGVTGGALGALIQGFRRATFSNEAGIGTAAIAHSAVKTDRPVTEGFVALLEPFLDTVVICTMTALVIIVSGVSTLPGQSGSALTSAAFATALPWFPWVLTVAVILFAFSTLLSYSYYGTKAVTYLFGESPRLKLGFRLLFLVFTVIGAAMSLGPVIDFSDSMLFAMSIPNIIGLYLLAPVVRRELAAYRRDLAAGRIPKYPAGQPEPQ